MSQIGFGALLPLLLVLTGGWLLLRSRYCQPFIWWQSGYNLYFRVALAGILCLVPGLIVATIFIGFGLVESSCDNGDANVLFSFQCQQETFTLADWLNLWVDAVSFAAWLTPLFGAIGWGVGKFWPKENSSLLKNKQEKIVQRKRFEGYIKKTMEEHSFLLITLKSRKVYVGMVMDSILRFNELDEGEQKYLRVIVALSGYRRDADMQMRLTTDYLDQEFQKCIREANQSSTDQEDGRWKVKLEVMIPVKEITSIQPFDPQVYREFFMGREDGVDRG
ncbi:MAG: hypothetical protein OXU94_10545 [Gammaproteobacteria bacterium]|nr:hypothetical protein [Gammaproteobacteria bacterium]